MRAARVFGTIEKIDLLKAVKKSVNNSRLLGTIEKIDLLNAVKKSVNNSTILLYRVSAKSRPLLLLSTMATLAANTTK